MHESAQRVRTAARGIGGLLGAVGVVFAILTMACSQERPVEQLETTESVPFDGSTSAHVTLHASRAAIDESDGFFWVSMRFEGSGAALHVTPDDAALDAHISQGFEDGSARLELADIASACPAEGPCAIGVTLEITAEAAGVLALRSALSRDGAFSSAATLELDVD
jgi:hypothetical protein